MSDLLAQLDQPQASEHASMPYKEIALSPFLVLPLHPCCPHDCCHAIGNEPVKFQFYFPFLSLICLDIFYGLNAIWVLSIITLLLIFASSIITMVSEMFGPSTRPNVIHMPVMELVVM